MFCCHPEPSCCAIGNTLVVHITRLDPAHCITLRTLGCAHCAPWVARIAHLDCANCAVCSLYARSYVHFCFLEFQCFLHNPCLRTLVYAYIYIYYIHIHTHIHAYIRLRYVTLHFIALPYQMPNTNIPTYLPTYI